MPLIRLTDFGQAGLNVDRMPSTLHPGEWSRLENIDIEAGDIRSSWGDSLVSGSPPIAPRFSYVFEGEVNTYLIISDGEQVYAFNGETWQNISPEDVSSTSYIWDDVPGTWDDTALTWDDAGSGGTPATFAGVVTFTTFLGTLVVNSSEGVPAYWPGSSGRMVPLPGWPTGWNAQAMVAYTNVLVAIGVSTSIPGGAYRVAWSDFAVEGEIPQEWETTDVNSAGQVLLQDSPGYLTVAEILRDNLIVYKNDSIYRMFPSGDSFVFRFERVISDRGCDSAVGVTALGNVHFFADRGDLRVFDGQQTQSVAIAKIRDKLTEAIDDESRDKTIVQAYPERDEVWVGVVPAGASTVDAVVIYNTVHQSWTLKRYSGILSICLGPIESTSIQSGATWDTAIGSWDSYRESWNSSTYNPTEDAIVLCFATKIWRSDRSITDGDGIPKRCVAERTGFTFDDLEQRVTLRSVYPEIDGSGTVSIAVGFQWEAGGPTQWSLAQPFIIGATRKLNFRVTGKPVGVRVSSYDASTEWRLGAVSFEVVPAGLR